MATGQMIDVEVIGHGLLFDRTNDVQFPNFVRAMAKTTMENLTVPVGDLARDQHIPIRQLAEGRIEFREIHASAVASITGGAAAANTISWVEREEETIAAGVVTVGSGSDTILYSDAIQIFNQTNGFRYRLASGAPNEGEAQVGTPSADDITFNTAENGDIVEVSWFKSVAGGETVTIEPTDMPTSFDLLVSLRAYDRAGGAYWTDGLHLYLRSCKRKGDFNLVDTAVREMGTFGMDFDIDGDIQYYTPST